MAENLNFNVPNNSWYFLDDSVTYAESVGRLYNWESAKLAVPPGWHLPSKSEFEVLLSKFEYKDLIEGGTSGFNAQFCGFRYENGEYDGYGSWGDYFTITASSSEGIWVCDFAYYDKAVNMYSGGKMVAISVRCLKD